MGGQLIAGVSYQKTTFERPFGPVGTFTCPSCAMTAAHVVVVRGFTQRLYGVAVGGSHMSFALRCVACAAERPLDTDNARQALASIGAKPEDAIPPAKLTRQWILVLGAVICIPAALAQAVTAFSAPSSALAGHFFGTAIFGALAWLCVRSLLRRRQESGRSTAAAPASAQPSQEQLAPAETVAHPAAPLLGVSHFPTTILPGQ